MNFYYCAVRIVKKYLVPSSNSSLTPIGIGYPFSFKMFFKCIEVIGPVGYVPPCKRINYLTCIKSSLNITLRQVSLDFSVRNECNITRISFILF